MTEPLWWVIADVIWAGPGRWLGPSALPMRGPVAAGGDPVPPGELPAGARTLEYEGMLVPGLQDAHVHSGLIDLPALRRGGISAALDLGGVPDHVGRLRQRSFEPASDLPRLEVVGAFLTAPGGYPSDRSWAAPGSWREVQSAGDAEAAVSEQVAVGAGAIKVAINLDAGPVLAPDVLAALVAAAHAAGRPVIAHAEGAVEGSNAVRMAVTAGVDVLAHTPWTEELDPGLVRDCAAQTTWISTLAIHDRGQALTVAMDNLARFLSHGGSLRYGTDLGNGTLPLGVNSQETLALQTLGLSVDELLATMTGPMLGSGSGLGLGSGLGSGSGLGTSSESRFVAGVAPGLLVNPLEPRMRVVGPFLRQAQVFTVEDIVDMEQWQR